MLSKPECISYGKLWIPIGLEGTSNPFEGGAALCRKSKALWGAVGWEILLMAEILHQVIWFFFIPFFIGFHTSQGGCLGFQPSTVLWKMYLIGAKPSDSKGSFSYHMRISFQKFYVQGK